jgi:Protein of unknown function (DUF2721)
MANLVADVLGAMITPAVLISAGGTLVLSTSNRLSRVVDRVRVLAADADRLQPASGPPSQRSERETQKRQLLTNQLRDLSRRAILLRSAIAALYVAIALLIMTSIGVGIFTAFDFDYSFIPISLGMFGTGGLLWATALLVREARLAISSTLEEMEFAGAVLREKAAGE